MGCAGTLAVLGIKDFDSGMPAYEGLIAVEDIWNILAYILSAWPVRERDI
ncbi:Cytochrome c, class I [Sulfitobacter guttiformis KCTC 32187]|nr:Cytochrome c, class I [Sulfitobacter guttiformis KCTC 32187]